MHAINTLTWTMSVCLCVCLSVTNVTSLPQCIVWERGYKVYYNAYAGNESPNCCSGRHGHLYYAIASYWRATKAGQTSLEQAKTTIDEPDFITGQTTLEQTKTVLDEPDFIALI